MKRLIFFIIVFIMSIYGLCWPTIINVPADSSTIQGGINGSSDGDTVLVQPGTYYENINFVGQNIVLGSLFLTTGDTSYIPQTIIDGSLSGSVVLFINEEDSCAVLTGFTIRNGNSIRGAGILCRVNSNPTIRNNRIYGNAGAFGAGICCGSNSNPNIINNSVFGNSAEFGAGIYCQGSSPSISNNVVTGNTASLLGGGIYCVDNSDPNIINGTISENFATNSGGGIYCSNSSPIIINSIFWADSISSGWEEIYADEYSFPVLTYCDIRGGWQGEGNIDINPLFRDPAGGDFHLNSIACGDNADSPCIDMGDIYHIDFLLDCSWGLGTELCDMGAYGGGDTATVENRIINVPGDYHTIQQGIDASNDGDTVLVQPGTYVENVNFNGHSIVLGSLFMMTGDTSFISTTIIDGDSAGSVITLENGEDTTTVIKGFSIRHGRGIYTGGHFNGGGITSRNDSSPQIVRNYIVDNYSDNSGGGILFWDCNISICKIIENLIMYNIADVGGGGIRIEYSNVAIKGNQIAYNSGGGILYTAGYGSIESNFVFGNTADFGAGIGFSEGDFIVNNNVVRNNISAFNGGGIRCYEARNSFFINNMVGENVAGEYGGGIYSGGNYSLYVVNNIFWGNIAGIDGDGVFAVEPTIITYCDIQDTLWPGSGNISIDPLFRDPDNGDFHLMSVACGDSADSPCIDAGDPNINDTLLDCSWGLGGFRSDMGAYGGGESPISDISEDRPPTPHRLTLNQNYPNPFNARTTISFILPEAGFVQLTIYDLLGRKVTDLSGEFKPVGSHEIIFDASDLSSGVYFYRLQAGDKAETKRMVLMK